MNRPTPDNPSPANRPQPEARLSEQDARLLDLLIEQGPAALPQDDARARTLVQLWSLIHHWPTQQPSADLIKRTLATIDKQQAAAPQGHATPRLSPEDAALVDALAESGRLADAAGPLPAGSADRAANLRDLLALLDHAPEQQAAPSSDLTAKTLARIAEHDRAQPSLRLADHAPLAALGRQAGSRAVLTRIGTAAAVALVSASVLLPVLSKARSDAKTVACQDNLREAGHGLAAYSDAHDGALPQSPTDTFGLLSRFAQDARPQSPADGTLPVSSINLYLLPRQGYVAAANLRCPGADQADYYNAQNALAGHPIRLADFNAPLLADNNPLYRRVGNALVRNHALPDDTPSANHRGAGQNLLDRDGSTRWVVRPAVQHGQADDILWVRDGEPGRPDTFLTP